MNGPADKNDDFSDWDSLATELGIDSVPAAETAPVAPPAAKHVPAPAPPPPVKQAEVVVEKPAVIVPAPVREVASDDPFGADLDDEKSNDDTVMEDGPEVPEDDLPTGEAGKEGDGRKRRRRRRRKKGPGEATPGAAESADGTELEPVEAIAEEAPAEIVGEAASELEDDFDADEPAAPATLDAELEDNSTEPLPEWKVMAWTDLLASLYRPQDH